MRIVQTSRPRLQSRRCRPQVNTLQPTTGTSGLSEFGLKRVAKPEGQVRSQQPRSIRRVCIYFTYLATAPTSAPAPPSRPSNGSDGQSREQTTHSGTPSSTSTPMRVAIRHPNACVAKESLSANIEVDKGSTLPLKNEIEISPDDPDEDIEPHCARSGSGMY